MVTGNVPVGVLVLVLIVSVSATGLPAVGKTGLDGWKLQLAPVGRPEQERFTAALNDPAAVT
jgi:hypothetical protein